MGWHGSQEGLQARWWPSFLAGHHVCASADLLRIARSVLCRPLRQVKALLVLLRKMVAYSVTGKQSADAAEEKKSDQSFNPAMEGVSNVIENKLAAISALLPQYTCVAPPPRRLPQRNLAPLLTAHQDALP